MRFWEEEEEAEVPGLLAAATLECLQSKSGEDRSGKSAIFGGNIEHRIAVNLG